MLGYSTAITRSTGRPKAYGTHTSLSILHSIPSVSFSTFDHAILLLYGGFPDLAARA
jgi:hypothetical protein